MKKILIIFDIILVLVAFALIFMLQRHLVQVHNITPPDIYIEPKE